MGKRKQSRLAVTEEGSGRQQNEEENDMERLFERLRQDSEFRKLVAGMNQRPAIEQTVKQVLDVASKADQACNKAPRGTGFDALHAVVVQDGPEVLASITQAVTQDQVERIERDAPREKKTTTRDNPSGDR